MHHKKRQPQKKYSGVFRHLIFSPKGAVDGLLIDIDREPTQVVIDPRGCDYSVFDKLKIGQQIKLSAVPKKSSKSDSPHALLRRARLLKINGKKVSTVDKMPKTFEGTVARFNYAKHGEPNGVVLDSGDFIHLRPDGMSAADLMIGDRIHASGDVRRLDVGQGHVISAREINGHKLKHGAMHVR